MFSVRFLFFHNKFGRFISYMLFFGIFTSFYINRSYEYQVSVNFIPIFLIVLHMVIPQLLRIIKLWRKSSYVHNDFTTISKEINSRVNKVYIKNSKTIFAYYNGFTNNIVISSTMINILNDDEIKGILYHELYHDGKKYGFWRRVTIGVLFIPLLIFASFLFWVLSAILIIIISYTLKIQSYLIVICIFSFMVIRLEKNRWKQEYEADLFAAKKIGLQKYISALIKIVPDEKKSWNWPSHPSINQRINTLRLSF